MLLLLFEQVQFELLATRLRTRIALPTPLFAHVATNTAEGKENVCICFYKFYYPEFILLENWVSMKNKKYIIKVPIIRSPGYELIKWTESFKIQGYKSQIIQQSFS